MTLSYEAVEARRAAPVPHDRVIFQVRSLYGLSTRSVALPLGAGESIESGQISFTIDPEADLSTNVGMIDYANCSLRVRYSVHAVFPGLHDLVRSGRYDLELLRPVRATATDECTVSPDYRGWRALGCMDFLPGSIWAGASGG